MVVDHCLTLTLTPTPLSLVFLFLPQTGASINAVKFHVASSANGLSKFNHNDKNTKKKRNNSNSNNNNDDNDSYTLDLSYEAKKCLRKLPDIRLKGESGEAAAVSKMGMTFSKVEPVVRNWRPTTTVRCYCFFRLSVYCST